MTVAQQTPYNVAVGNAASTVFPYTWQALQAADIGVYLDGALKTLNVDYTVSGTGLLTGGNVTFTAAPAAGVKVTLTRNMVKYRPTDYQQVGDFQTAVVNPDIDRAILISQELAAADSRSIRVAPYEQGANMLLPPKATRANQFLYCDANGDLALAAVLASGVLSQSSIGGYLTPQTTAEIAAGVMPVKTWYGEGEVRRYGAFLDGVIDDTVFLQNWAKVGGALSFSVARTAKVTAQIPLVSNTTITAAKGAAITTATGDISIFYATGQSNITITGLNFTQTVAGAAAYVGHVALVNCTDCHIDNCTSDGYQWSGFYIDGGLRCYVTRNHITNGGATNDSADITLYRQCNYCYVAFNECFGTGKTGIFVQDPYSLPQLTPFKNTVTHNKVGAHAAYGIVLYCPARAAAGGMNLVNAGSITAAGAAYTDGQYNGVAVTALTGIGSGATANVTVAGGVVTAFYCATIGGNYSDLDTVTVAAALIGGTGAGFIFTLAVNTVCQPLNTYNEISHNLVQDIIGTYLAGASGMGIYAVGAGIGGAKIIGNTVKNCCTGSSGGALAQAAITVAGLPAFAGGAAVELIGNQVAEQTQYQGLYLTGMQTPVIISAGSIMIPSTNALGATLRITNCSNVTVGGGISIVNQGTGQGVLVQSLTNTSAKINFGTMQVTSAAGTPFSVTQALGLGVPDFKLIGADISTTSGTPNGLSLSGLIDGIVTGNKISVGNQAVLNANDCIGMVYESNVLKRLAGTVVVSFGGTGSGSFFGKSNRGVAANGAVVNGAAAGVMIELNGSAVPGAGTWAAGDRVNQSVPAVGQPKGWRNTVSGAPGTWVSEGNL